MRIVALALLGVLSSGCFQGQIDEVKAELAKTREALQEQMEKTRKTAENVADTVAIAVPGERYLRLIDDFHGPDPKKKAAAAAFLKSLFNLDVDVPYRYAVHFGFDEANALRADTFRGPTPSEANVINFFDKKHENFAAVRNTLSLPFDSTAAEDRLSNAAYGIIDEITGGFNVEKSQARSNPPQLGITTREQDVFLRYPYRKAFFSAPVTETCKTQYNSPANYLETCVAQQQKTFTDRGTADRAAIASKIVAAFKVAYEKRVLPLGAAQIDRSWALLDGNDYLYVLIPESDLAAHKAKRLAIEAHVYNGESKATFDSTRAYAFDLAEFDRNPPVVHPVHGRVRWATHNMVGRTLYSEKLRQQLTELHERRTRIEANR